MDLLQNLSDDQIVAIGSTVALGCCVGLMYLSHALGRSESVRGRENTGGSQAAAAVRAKNNARPGRRDAA